MNIWPTYMNLICNNISRYSSLQGKLAAERLQRRFAVFPQTGTLRLHAIYVVAGLFMAAPLHAATLSYFGSYQLDYADNLELASDGGTAGVYHSFRIGAGYEERSTRLEANINGSLHHINYPNGVLDDSSSIYLNGDLRWAFVRERLYWVFADSLTNQPIDPREANIPSNWQQTNVFSTGPQLQYQFDQANRVQADIRYMNSWAEESGDFDADRWFVGGSWIYGSAAATDISLNATFYDVRFDENGSEHIEDYNRSSLFAAWERRNGPSSLRFEAGLVGMDFDESSDEYGWHGLVTWSRVISSSSSLLLNIRHGLTDSALSIAGDVNPDNIGTSVVSGQAYEVTAVDATYRYGLSNSVLELLARYRKQDYVTDALVDRDLINTTIRWIRFFSGGWSSELSGRFSWNEYDDGRSDDLTYLYAGMAYQGTRHLTYRLGMDWASRNSTDPMSEYDNWGVMFSIRYAR
ncbi:hypothetical protein [Thiolapillus sp.]